MTTEQQSTPVVNSPVRTMRAMCAASADPVGLTCEDVPIPESGPLPPPTVPQARVRGSSGGRRHLRMAPEFNVGVLCCSGW